jgi:perosamine synthetase
MKYFVFEPELDESDVEAVTQAVRRGEISGTFGSSIPSFEEEFASYTGMQYGMATSSGTSALHLAVAALDLNTGDEVLVSASTNIATALAVYHNGGITVPIDSEEQTWNLDIGQIEQRITPKTKGIIAVHLFGHPIDMDQLMAVAEKHNLWVIEDAAEAHGAEIRGRKAGSFGHMSCFSFYANKLITTGEGGMVLTNDISLAEKVKSLRNLAFGKPRFFHQHAGYNFRMTGMQAALGLSQLTKIDRFIEKKRTLAQCYRDELHEIDYVDMPNEASWAKHVYWMIGIRVDSRVNRDDFAQYLRINGVDTRTFFCSMASQPFLKEQKDLSKTTPIADKLWKEGLYLPSSTFLKQKDVAEIGQIIRAFPS